ncbi:Polycomb protein eed-B [Apiospora marii]|uniref:Polycomb protein eed-B n=1 Tax=Apiospora marii TaxID=335849 RepID=A0ABR1SCE3_9PEZI
MPPALSYNEWDLPRLKISIGFEVGHAGRRLSLYDVCTDVDRARMNLTMSQMPTKILVSHDRGRGQFFDVKFFPYLPAGEDPIFAAVSKKHIVIYRLSSTSVPPYELIQLFRDDDETAVNCSCTWSKDRETDIPYLCVAGWDAKIKVYDVFNGNIVKTLVGHGAEINDLVTCPTNPYLIASASDDTTVRIWSLDPADEKQPCVCILGGEGHSSGLLTIAFHNCGRYVLSAGHDNCVCLWTLPDLSTRATGRNPVPPIVVHYPHFFTSEVHGGIVDCVAFFGDLVLSRACHEDVIVLWRIEGFSSQDPPPLASSAPTTSDTERLTRSAFAPATASENPPQYTRLVQFHTPGSGHQFYMRFKLFHVVDKHPVLAFANAHSTIFFWDLARLMGYHSFMTELDDPARDHPVQRPSWLMPVQHRQNKGDAVSKLKDAEDKDSVVSGRTGSDLEGQSSLGSHYSEETLKDWSSRYDIKSVETPVMAHYKSGISVKDFIGRQVAWSPEGEWCIVVGSKNLAFVLSRWQKNPKDEKKS